MHTSVQRDINSDSDLKADPCIYARWGNQNYRKGNAVKCPRAIFHSAKSRMTPDLSLSLFRNENGTLPYYKHGNSSYSVFSQNVLYRVFFSHFIAWHIFSIDLFVFLNGQNCGTDAPWCWAILTISGSWLTLESACVKWWIKLVIQKLHPAFICGMFCPW